jgi:hypothetical protein
MSEGGEVVNMGGKRKKALGGGHYLRGCHVSGGSCWKTAHIKPPLH